MKPSKQRASLLERDCLTNVDVSHFHNSDNLEFVEDIFELARIAWAND